MIISGLKRTLVIRILRDYYNAVVEVLDRLDNGIITTSESEAQLISLDEQYAEEIVKINK